MKVRFSWNYRKHVFSKWLRNRHDRSTNNIDPFTIDHACMECNLTRQEITSIINYWRTKTRVIWDYIHDDTETVVKDWETFLNNINNNYDVFFLTSQYHKDSGNHIWFQPDFGEKEERDNVLLDRHIKGLFTRLDEMAMMGEIVTATHLPAQMVVSVLKPFDQKYLRNGQAPPDGTLYSDRMRVYTCPDCKTGKMHQKRSGDWQCRECRITYLEDEFNEMIKASVPS